MYQLTPNIRRLDQLYAGGYYCSAAVKQQNKQGEVQRNNLSSSDRT